MKASSANGLWGRRVTAWGQADTVAGHRALENGAPSQTPKVMSQAQEGLASEALEGCLS